MDRNSILASIFIVLCLKNGLPKDAVISINHLHFYRKHINEAMYIYKKKNVSDSTLEYPWS